MKVYKTAKWIPILLLIISTLACQFILGEEATPTTVMTQVINPDPSETDISTSTLELGTTILQSELRQWAFRAIANSQYDDPSWSAMQAAGPPDTNVCGDIESAWATAYRDESAWLLLEYEKPVKPTEVRIHQTFNPTSVVSVQLIDTNNQEHVVYNATPKPFDCPYVLSIPVDDAEYLTRTVRVIIDQSILADWNEIDAVELIGMFSSVDDSSGSPIATVDLFTNKLAPDLPPGGKITPEIPPPLIDTPDAPPPQDYLPPVLEATPPPFILMPFDPSRWFFNTFDESKGLPENKILSLAVDWNWALWIATNSQGVASFSSGDWIRYSEDEGPQVAYARLIRLAPDGALWFAGNGVTRYDGESVRHFYPSDGLVGNNVQDIAFAPDGSVWFAAVGGVSRFDGVNWTNFTTENGLPSENINCIAISSDGQVWVGTWDGAARLGGASWVTFTTEDGLGHNMVHDIAEGPDGSLWFATGGKGVSRFDGRDWSVFYSDDTVSAPFVRSVSVAPDGAVWFGGENSGVFRYDGDGWLYFGVEDGLAGPYVDDIAFSLEGMVYIGTRRSGISLLAPQ